MLTSAASAFETDGWEISTTPLPRALPGLWQTGWKVVAEACRRFHFPPSVNPRCYDLELVILPTTFVGLGSSPSLDSEEYTKMESLGPNVYLPSSHLMARSIARTHISHAEKGTNFYFLLRAWAEYFYLYCNFHAGSLDDAEEDVQKFWRSISPANWQVKGE
ncbi:uncharacterized protein FOMMEDRAFT_18646 [Fomitiporia mediterranea MF3/22]|uniref:uncharacterized protein n=1 Tax=Fomitiporia mediterranea (strain MF3/22) TaxID=694068 RepID=UPI0004407C47|nr:uncharacterized protein FOMMEDRAFT_18646 [Fomitiporia mediterranea MF3/22]EJD04954.1 hypothetical protein FOMMEDRAFT_18646 [Fomitiporia mediterranea MF3/22]